MESQQRGWLAARTERLDLRAVSSADLGVLYELLSDARVWTHFPSGVHTDRQQTADQLTRFRHAWDRDGLGYWTAWLHGGSFVGIGGCMMTHGVAWNLYYRVRPEQQGHGYATELAMAARVAASSLRPDLPVVASLLAHNAASRAVALAAGLHQVWEGRDPDGATAGQLQLLFADRDLTEEQVETVLRRSRGKPGR
jgi:RimJ/RimL family protein N-acetyltransferase